MREIEFRGKEIYGNNEWAFGTGIVRVQEDTYDTKKWEIVQKVNYDELDYFIPAYETKKIDINTLGQYTGLKDKNGKKIYEEDIIKALFYGKEVIGKIEFLNGAFTLTNSAVSDNQVFIFEELEVIGNIYDNPEVLKKRSKNKLNRPCIKLSRQLYKPIGSTITKLAEKLKETFDTEVEVIKKEEKKMDIQVEEIWKDISGCNNYQISNFGKVKSK